MATVISRTKRIYKNGRSGGVEGPSTRLPRGGLRRLRPPPGTRDLDRLNRECHGLLLGWRGTRPGHEHPVLGDERPVPLLEVHLEEVPREPDLPVLVPPVEAGPGPHRRPYIPP